MSCMGDSGHTVMRKVLLLMSGKVDQAGVNLDADISLSFSFGSSYIWFNPPISSSSEQMTKHPCFSSVFDVLLVNAAMHDVLHG